MEFRGKIEGGKSKLEKDKKARKISETEYRNRKEKIDKAEAAVNDLEQKVQKGKEFNQSDNGQKDIEK